LIVKLFVLAAQQLAQAGFIGRTTIWLNNFLTQQSFESILQVLRKRTDSFF